MGILPLSAVRRLAKRIFGNPRIRAKTRLWSNHATCSKCGHTLEAMRDGGSGGYCPVCQPELGNTFDIQPEKPLKAKNSR